MVDTYTPMPVALRRDADTAGVPDGQPTGVFVDNAGRVKVSAVPALVPLVTGNIAAANAQVAINVAQVSNLVLHCKGVFAGVNCAFEASLDSTDGANGTWFSVLAVRSNGNTLEASTGVIAAAPAYAWEVSVNGYVWFRVRATAWTSGTCQWLLQPAPYATEPAPAIQNHGITGSVTVQPVAASPYSLTSAASTNAAVIKSSTGTLGELTVSNPTATAAYVKLYDKATAPTVGTDVPKVTIPVPAGQLVALQFGIFGKRFGSGIAIAITGAAAATDTAASVAGIQVHGDYN